MKTICFAICGAIYENANAIEQIKILKKSYNIIPVVSEITSKNKLFVKELESLTNSKVIDSIYKAEKFGPSNISNAMIICPCTGNTLAKIANAISDNTVTMLCKAHQRNNNPIIIAISSNDILGLNAYNLAKLLNAKNFYFVPFAQDNPEKKPKSLKSDFGMLTKTLKSALKGIQLQPLLIK